MSLSNISDGSHKALYTADDVEEVACPLCGADEPQAITYERGALRVVRCAACSAVYCSPRLRRPGAHFWRDAQVFLEESRLIFEGRAGHHRDPNYDDDLRLIARFQPVGRLLDVGTNLGMFLRRAIGRGWELHGVEPSPSLSRIAAEHLGIPIRTGYLADVGYPADFFDVVVLTDVLEHVTQPNELLAEIRRILKPGGLLLAKVPNLKWNELKFSLARRFGRITDNDIFDAYERVVHYSEPTLVRALERAGLHVIHMDVARPVQSPVWHRYVGHYYQSPSPWILDWQRHLGRLAFYALGRLERALTGHIGSFAPNIRSVSRKVAS